MGIPELALPHLDTPPIKEWTELRESPEEPGLMLPYFTFPENSLIVLDECQRVYRLRPNASKVPDHVAAFETHRHTGVDFVLMTQHPQLVDAHVRKLVGRHIHLRDVGLLGRWLYEWPECTDVGQFRNAPVKKKYKLPKGAFSLYKSASLHIKQSRTLPPALIVLGVALVGVLGFGWHSFNTIYAKTVGEPSSSSRSKPSSKSNSSDEVEVDPDALKVEMIARVYDRPETAPVYDALRVAKEMPETVGCIRYGDGCNCYTHQGTKALVSKSYCEAWMAGNRPFNPYRMAPVQIAQHETLPPEERPKAATVLSAPGEKPLWMRPPQVSSSADKQPQQSAHATQQPM